VSRGDAVGPGASYRSMPLDQLLEAFADATPAPGGGGGAVLAVALSASLCVMAARLSTRHESGASDVARQALAIRDDMAPLCDEDAHTYLDVIAASRATAEDPADRRRRLHRALSAASDVPMATVAAAAQVARLAAGLAEEGNPTVRGDAAVAALLAGAGAEAAAVLVRINLAGHPDDDRPARARSLLDETTGWVDRARRAAGVLA
jgi:methenyltetrahydrofolate cyclohydrolase